MESSNADAANENFFTLKDPLSKNYVNYTIGEFPGEERRLHGPAVFNRVYVCDFCSTGQFHFDIETSP